jgi:hypothetical protein
MGIIKQVGGIANVGSAVFEDVRLNPKEENKAVVSMYQPTDEEKATRAMIIRHFTLGYQTMYKPRREFNDLAVIGRMQVDQMSFNTYQPNNGEAPENDLVNGWRSRAIRPIVRNKCVSIAAHATAKLIFPKVFAFDEMNKGDHDAAKVMEDLMVWAADQSDYNKTSFYSVVSALVNPASIIYTEYGEVYRNIKESKNDDGTWETKKMLDESYSGFKDEVVPVDELFIENIYEHDIQKQGFLIRRKVISYDTALVKYGEHKNFKFVKPGILTIFGDANATFYEVYDTTMRQEEVEEVTYWNKALDVKIVMCNGILVTDYDAPNPRQDKQYPFIKYGYELIDEGKFFYYKSLAFKLQQDANIINTLYPLIIDGTYLSVMPPMVNYGSETIGADVIIPGAVTTLTDPNSKLTAMETSKNLQMGKDILQNMVEESVEETSQANTMSGQIGKSGTTAYEISKIEANAGTILGLFIKMISQFVKDYGKLRVSDILQFMTITDIEKLGDGALPYKSFLINAQKIGGKNKRVIFDGSLPDEPISGEDLLNRSFDVLSEQGGLRSDTEVARVNPRLFRELKYKCVVSPDVMQPRSEDLERAMKLELFDRAIQLGPAIDQEKVAKDFLFGAYGFISNPEDYMNAGQAIQAPAMQNQNPLEAAGAKNAGQTAGMTQNGLPLTAPKPMV